MQSNGRMAANHQHENSLSHLHPLLRLCKYRIPIILSACLIWHPSCKLLEQAVQSAMLLYDESKALHRAERSGTDSSTTCLALIMKLTEDCGPS